MCLEQDSVASRYCLILRALERGNSEEEQTEALKAWGYSSAGRAPALQAGGQEFEPPYLHQHGLIAQVVRARA